MAVDLNVPPGLGDVKAHVYAEGGCEHEWRPFKHTRLYTNAFVVEGNKVCRRVSLRRRSVVPWLDIVLLLDLAVARFQETWFWCRSVSRFFLAMSLKKAPRVLARRRAHFESCNLMSCIVVTII